MPDLPPVASPCVERCWQIMTGFHIATRADAIDYLWTTDALPRPSIKDVRSWRQAAQVDGPRHTGHRSRSDAAWWDLIRPDTWLAQAAETAARQAGERAALAQVLREPTMIVERGVRVPPFVFAHWRAGRWGVRHA